MIVKTMAMWPVIGPDPMASMFLLISVRLEVKGWAALTSAMLGIMSVWSLEGVLSANSPVPELPEELLEGIQGSSPSLVSSRVLGPSEVGALSGAAGQSDGGPELVADGSDLGLQFRGLGLGVLHELLELPQGKLDPKEVGMESIKGLSIKTRMGISQGPSIFQVIRDDKEVVEVGVGGGHCC